MIGHQPLKWFISVKDPTSPLVRWKLKVKEYYYKPGKQNQTADCLSRMYVTVHLQSHVH